MARLASSKTAQIWAERIAQCEGSYVDTAQFCQSTGCSLTSLLPVETQTRFDPIHSILTGLVKFLAVGCGLNEIAGGLRQTDDRFHHR
jgi:hypothetical protein